jgi:hypothetical protein
MNRRNNTMRRLVLLLTVAAGAAFAAPAIAQAPSISLTISKLSGGPDGTVATVNYGQLVELSGDVSGPPQAGQTVEIVVAPYRGETTIEPVQTDAAGEFTFRHRPFIKTSYTARSSGSTSAQEPFAFVRPVVKLTRLNRPKGWYAVRVNADDQHVSRVVWFQRRVTRTKWATVKRVRLSRALTVRFTAKLPRGTRWVRAVTPQTPGYLSATSTFVRVK